MDILQRNQSHQNLWRREKQIDWKNYKKNWLIILALGKGLEAEEPLKDKVGIEEDFLFNFLMRDQKSLEDKEEDSLLKNVDFKWHW